MEQKILVHACCGPCAAAVIDFLRAGELEPTLYFYNPNIHPKTEFRLRKKAFFKLARKKHVHAISYNYYNMDAFLRKAEKHNPRCEYCYETRLFKTAEYAARNGFTAFTTTLLISPYQKHELVKEVCERAARRCGVEFLYRDFRPLFYDGQAEAKRLELYRQKYCGCLFSITDKNKPLLSQ